ncbi:molybdopterin molybdotransferase MoeA [Alteromonas sp. CYL-A6]|uniref:molybdopterin molybdotransferase MoeA n=1 Tax=Alteromonas nitratireducens TaxID=3390813 RepID=UPI0034A73D17
MTVATTWLTLSEAKAALSDSIKPLSDSQRISLNDALGRVLAHPLTATHHVPPWDNAAMDGYAINTQCHTGSPLPVQATIHAGSATVPTLKAGHAIRIMTGAPVPDGADAVVMQENTSVDDTGVSVTVWPAPGENIRQTGSDVTRGQTLIEGGTRLSAAHLMLLASQGLHEVEVIRPVRVALLANGNELCEPGGTAAPSQLFEANRTGMRHLLSPFAVTIIDKGIIADDRHALQTAFDEAARDADVILSSGGVSVGDADFIKEVVAENGHIDLWKVAIKPGKPFAFGRYRNAVFCGVPGNPVSAYVTTQMLVLPMIRSLSGEQNIADYDTAEASLTQTIRRQPGRLEFMRAVAEKTVENRLRVTPLPRQSSAVMTTVTQANCYIQLEAGVSCVEQDSMVTILPFSQTGLSG